MRKLLLICDAFATEYDIKFNAQKYKLLVFSAHNFRRQASTQTIHCSFSNFLISGNSSGRHGCSLRLLSVKMTSTILARLHVASWNYDVSIVGIFVNQIFRRGSGKVGCINDKGHWTDSGSLYYAGRDVRQS